MWLRYVNPYCDGEMKVVESASTPTFLPFIAMKTVDNGIVPWLASQTDILATDWELVA